MNTTITLRGNIHHILDISKWLKNKGYTHDRDYLWSREVRDSDQYIIVHTREPKLATLIALQFSNLNPIQGIHPDLKQPSVTDTMWLGSISQ